MALVSVNAPRGRQQNDGVLEKILKGVQIAQGVLGTALEVPKYLKESKYADAKARLADESAREQQVKTDVTLSSKTRPATEEEQAAGGVDLIKTPRLGVRVIREEEKLGETEKERLKDIYRDFTPAEEGSPGSISFDIGNKRIWVQPKPLSQGADRRFNQTTKMRQEYQTQSKEFQKQTDAYGRLLAAGTEPSAAGDLALIFNYMKILDPGSVVRESEFANAAATGSLGERAQAAVSKIAKGERLSDEMRRDFLDRGKKLFEQARKQQAGRVDSYTMLSNEQGLNPRMVIVPIDVRPLDSDSFRAEMRELVESFKGKAVPIQPDPLGDEDLVP